MRGVRAHHRFLLARHLEHIDFLDEQIATFDEQIAVAITQDGAGGDMPPPSARAATAPPEAAPATEASVLDPTTPLTWEQAVTIWDEIPGIGRRVAEHLVAEVGVNGEQFASAAHLASWAKLCPGNHESAGKRKRASIGRGNNWLRTTLIQAAHAAARVKESYLSAFYQRVMRRSGKKKAIVALAHKILVLAYTLVRKREHYQEPGAAYLDERQQDKLLHRLRQRIEQLGYNVTLEPREPVLV